METEVVMSPAAKEAAAAAMFSPYSSPSTVFLLQRRVLSWYVKLMACCLFLLPSDRI